MPGPLDKNLHSGPARPHDQLPQHLGLRDLGRIRCIRRGARPQPVTEADGSRVRPAYLEHIVKALVERVLRAPDVHPGGQHRPAAAHDSTQARGAVKRRYRVLRHAAMQRQKVDPIRGVSLDDADDVVALHITYIALIAQRGNNLVDGDCSHGDAAGGPDAPARFIQVAAGREVHDGIRARRNRHLELAQLGLDGGEIGRRADVGIHLCAQAGADAHRAGGTVGRPHHNDGAQTQTVVDGLRGGSLVTRDGLDGLARDALVAFQLDAHRLVSFRTYMRQW